MIPVLVAMMAAPAAQAQWVMVARAVSGRIQRMEQQQTANNGGYDVATVILEAEADKVYETALSALQAHSSKVTVTATDAKKMMVKFTDGVQNASLQATSLGPTVTQLVIASNAVEKGQSGTSIVLQGVLKVCKDMNVTCTVGE
jgi:predicted ATP-dependent Lon-type protease